MIYVTAFEYVRISNKNTFIEMSQWNYGETYFASFDGVCYDDALSIFVKGDT